MRFNQLRPYLLNYPVFGLADIAKWFPEAKPDTLKVQLNHWVAKGYLTRLKRGLFWLSEAAISDHFYLVEKILSPSYISLETALNYYSLIPDVPQVITCLTPLNTRKFDTPAGSYFYRHIKPVYFFGYKTVSQTEGNFFYNIATPEKAVVDFIYFNLKRLSGTDNFEEERFLFERDFAWSELLAMARLFQNKRVYATALKLKQQYGQDKI